MNSNEVGENNIRKKETIKVQILKYILPVYLCVLILSYMFYPGFSSETIDYLGIGILLWSILISIISIILGGIMGFRNINHNYNDLYKSNTKKIIISVLSSVLLYNIVSSIIMEIFSTILTKLCDVSDASFMTFSFFYYLLPIPLIVPLIRSFNKDNYVSRSSARKLFIALILLSDIIFIFNLDLVERCINLAFLFPFSIIALQNNSCEVNKNNKKSVITCLILTILFIVIHIIFLKMR